MNALSKTIPPLDDQGVPVGYPFNEDWELTPRQVKAMLDAGQALVLIDCRTPAEHAYCHLPGSTLAPLQRAGEHLPELQRYRDQKAVVYCHHGRRSLQMTMILRQAGFADVKSMVGGIELWAADIDPSVPRY
jgi:rhodanese-related sulfurtransferase